MQQFDGPSARQAGGLGGFGQNCVARGQGCRNLACEDRQGEIPRADTGENAARRRGEVLRLICVIAQEINGFAQLGDGIRRGFASLACQKGKELAEMVLIKIGRAFEGGCARNGGGLPWGGGIDGGLDILRGGLDHLAHHLGGGSGRGDGHALSAFMGCREHGGGLPCGAHEGRAGGFDLGEIGFVMQIKAARIHARAKKRLGFDHGDVFACILQIGEGVGGNDMGGHIIVQHLIDEGGVCAIFQQAPHQIGQEVTMCAHGGIDAAAGGVAFENDVMQGLAHAMKALEFKGLRVISHFDDGGNSMGVMGGELRVNAVGQPQQFARATDIGDIRSGLAGIDGKACKAFDLRAFDLGIPIGAFDQSQHDFTVIGFSQRIEPIDHGGRAQTVGLHHHAKPVPARQPRV